LLKGGILTGESRAEDGLLFVKRHHQRKSAVARNLITGSGSSTPM